MTGNPPAPAKPPQAGPLVVEAIRRLEAALSQFEDAYLAWVAGAAASRDERKERLDAAAARLREARARLAALEQALVDEERAASRG